MKRITLCTMLVLGIGFTGCMNPNKKDQETQRVNSTTSKTSKDMQNLISIVEIPITNFSRAVAFYQGILDVNIEETSMEGTQMGLFPSNGETVNVVLVKGDDYVPTASGTVVYLNAGNDLQFVLDKIERNGGKVIVPKTEISPEMGFFAMFLDTEGNKIGLHSTH